MTGIEERLRATAELEAMLADFWHDVDANMGHGAADFFTEDGVFEASERTYTGRETISKFYRFRRDRGARVAVHSIANFRVELASADEAICTWYLILFAADGEPVLMTAPPIQIARATDRCVRGEDGHWRYRHRKFDTLFKGGAPTTTMTAEYAKG